MFSVRSRDVIIKYSIVLERPSREFIVDPSRNSGLFYVRVNVTTLWNQHKWAYKFIWVALNPLLTIRSNYNDANQCAVYIFRIYEISKFNFYLHGHYLVHLLISCIFECILYFTVFSINTINTSFNFHNQTIYSVTKIKAHKTWVNGWILTASKSRP